MLLTKSFILQFFPLQRIFTHTHKHTNTTVWHLTFPKRFGLNGCPWKALNRPATNLAISKSSKESIHGLGSHCVCVCVFRFCSHSTLLFYYYCILIVLKNGSPRDVECLFLLNFFFGSACVCVCLRMVILFQLLSLNIACLSCVNYISSSFFPFVVIMVVVDQVHIIIGPRPNQPNKQTKCSAMKLTVVWWIG